MNGNNVFVSYKHSDNLVEPIRAGLAEIVDPTRCRDYVNMLEDIIENGIHTYRGEEDGNDLSQFKDNTIETRLKEKIRASSVTIVLVSKGMKTTGAQNDQWIPWEISYSLKEITTNGRTSRSNGLLAVIIPDENGSYSYFLDECSHCGTTTYKTGILFQILGANMFNLKDPSHFDSACFVQHGKIHSGNTHSYAHQVKWEDFIGEHETYINFAASLRDNISNYEIQKLAYI